jgi:hypothetical protein
VTEVVVLCPTRENPEGAREMLLSFHKTATRGGSELIFVVDEDDPKLREYVNLGELTMVVEGGSLTKATNEAVAQLWDRDIIIGHVGDDHHFVTEGWDEAVHDALTKAPGVAYMHDGFPTYWASMWFTNALVPRTLGWLALPGTYHLSIDDAFMDIGAGLGRLTYLDQVLVRHKYRAPGHEKDKERAIVHSHYTRTRREHEQAVYITWLELEYHNDIARLADALGLELDLAAIPASPGKAFRRALHLILPDLCPFGCCSGLRPKYRPQRGPIQPKMWEDGFGPGEQASLASLG